MTLAPLLVMLALMPPGDGAGVTCPDAKAVAAAKRACELVDWKDGIVLDTLATAYAEAGDFDEAVAWETKALPLMTDPAAKDRAARRLELFGQQKPYRDPAPGKA